MRILEVRFNNLNSLSGEWAIDFTHPAYTSNGIFAITGPTGAGKTTILDAICLALYGRTPRLNKVTKSDNEIMSRQTGECFAEVSFETQKGRFRCHWSQRRARKKSDGELQAPKHEITDLASGKVFEVKLRGVAEQVETVTGMDFDRFTRSMLLAQGGFDAFLKADPDKRAPILEQITGTEIYSQISIRVHERRSGERKKLDILQAELNGMQILGEEDERQLITGLDLKLLQESELNQQLTLKNQAIAWVDGIAALEKELSLIETQKRDWQTRQDVFEPDLEKLQRATQALELAGDHAGLTSIRREQETDRRSHSECLEMLPKCEAIVKHTEKAMNLAGEQLDKRKTEQKEASIIIRKARELDLRLREKDAPIKTTGDAITDMEKSLKKLRSQQDKDVVTVGNNKKTLEEVLKYLAETHADEALIENLAGIRNRFDALKGLQAQQNTKLSEFKAAEDQVTETIRIWNELAKNLDTQKRGLDSGQGALAQKQLELKSILETRELTDWRKSLSSLTEKKSLLDKAIETVQSLAESRQSLDELFKRHDVLIAEKSTLAEKLKTQSEKQALLEREMSLLETQLSLLKTIQNFGEARHKLQDGEPCPLCGAKEHPFAEGNIPVPDETMSALGKARTDLKTANDSVADLKVKQAEVNKDLEQVISGRKECSEKITVSENQILQHCMDLSIDSAAQGLDEILQRLQNENADMLGHSTRIVQTAEAIEKEIGTLRESLEKIKESVALAERETQTAAHKKDIAQQLIERVKNEAEALEAQYQNSLRETQYEVSAYGIDNLLMDAIDKAQLELTARRDQWVARQKEKSELDQQIAVLEVKTRHQAEQILKSDSEQKKQRDLLSGLECERDALSNERHELFGDRKPDDEETRLSSAIEASEKELDISRDVLNRETQELGKLKARIEELDKSMGARTIQLKTNEEAFLTRLGELGFADEANYLTACLLEDERKTLMQQAQKLTNEQIELASKERDKATQLETERQRQVTDQSREELDQELKSFMTNHKELQQKIGGIRQKLNDNEKLKQQQERTKAIDGQKRECSRWELLYELIGSADGKKYRNFAQGLTFEMMISHANRQLQKMTDRYLLIRDESQPLELNVIDNYQAGEIRSTKNLSGGESFIVSLSLALGLSHMASRNVQVDSLFLDEGFGTLDEDALETALETLAGLQQAGKLIGVISHVPALKERISTQIQVSTQSGGRSIIEGPGCRSANAGIPVVNE